MQDELVDQAQRGDAEAFDALARMVGDRCLAIAVRILRDIDLAEDAVQAALSGRNGEFGTAYRIRTGGLRLERAVSWASRRMRPGSRAPRERRIIPNDRARALD